MGDTSGQPPLHSAGGETEAQRTLGMGSRSNFKPWLTVRLGECAPSCGLTFPHLFEAGDESKS